PARMILVTKKETDPVPGFIDSRQADQFRPETRDDDAKPVLFVSKNIQMLAVSSFLCVRKLHKSLRRCVILSEVERSATKSKDPVELLKGTATGFDSLTARSLSRRPSRLCRGFPSRFILHPSRDDGWA